MAEECLIPGLPDDIAIGILARISHGYHGKMQVVSRRWNCLLQSSEYAEAQRRQGHCGDWLLVLTDRPESGRWNAFDPDAQRWHLLPPVPDVSAAHRHLGFGCVTIAGKLLVIGGYYTINRLRYFATNQVLQFDLITREWSRLAGMRFARCDFACAVVNGKVYVAGGSTSSRKNSTSAAEVYDLQLNRWELLPPLSAPRVECLGVCFRGMFHVVAGLDSGDDLTMAEVYDPESRSWKSSPGFWLLPRKPPCPLIALDGWLYVLDDWSNNGVKFRRPDGSGWEVLSGNLPVELQKLSHVGLAGLRSKLCVFGGMCFTMDNWPELSVASSSAVYLLPAKPGEFFSVGRMASMSRGLGSVVGSAVHEGPSSGAG